MILWKASVGNQNLSLLPGDIPDAPNNFVRKDSVPISWIKNIKIVLNIMTTKQ